MATHHDDTQDTLADAVDTLVATCARVGDDGTFSFARMATSELAGTATQLGLTPELLQWYERAAPATFRFWWGNEYRLAAPSQLAAYQTGYRWLEVGVEIPEWEWNPAWVVIGDWGGDPIIAHVDEPGTPVSCDIHGSGEWQPKRVAPDLASYLRALTIWIEIFLVKYEGDYATEDSDIRPAIAEEFAREIRTVLDDEHAHWWPWGSQ